MKIGLKFSLILFRKNMFLKKYKYWIPKKLSKKAIFLLIKESSDLFVDIICKYFNESFEKRKFLDYLKLANVTLAFENGARTSKNNYRPVSILPILSKLFEQLISKQLS